MLVAAPSKRLQDQRRRLWSHSPPPLRSQLVDVVRLHRTVICRPGGPLLIPPLRRLHPPTRSGVGARRYGGASMVLLGGFDAQTADALCDLRQRVYAL